MREQEAFGFIFNTCTSKTGGCVNSCTQYSLGTLLPMVPLAVCRCTYVQILVLSTGREGKTGVRRVSGEGAGWMLQTNDGIFDPLCVLGVKFTLRLYVPPRHRRHWCP